MVRLSCVECKGIFERRAAEAERNTRRGFTAFCSLACSAHYGNRRRLYSSRPEEHRNSYWTPFYVMTRAAAKNSKTKKHGCEVTPECLEELWRAQNGRCALSGVSMLLPQHKMEWTKKRDRVSLDRIDSAGDYVKGNVQLITCMANYCKHTWTNEDVRDFCAQVYRYSSGSQPS